MDRQVATYTVLYPMFAPTSTTVPPAGIASASRRCMRILPATTDSRIGNGPDTRGSGDRHVLVCARLRKRQHVTPHRGRSADHKGPL
jgi:hypothetical protein